MILFINRNEKKNFIYIQELINILINERRIIIILNKINIEYFHSN